MPTPFTQPALWPEIAPGRFARRIRPLTDDPAATGIAILGLPDDLGVRMNGGRPGAAGGPAAFRAALARYGADFTDSALAIHDAGDVIPAATLEETHARVTAAAEALHRRGLFPIAIGGGHDLTFPFVRAACNIHRVTAGLYLDAHLDVRDTPGSGMPFRALIEQCGVSRLHLVGCDEFANSNAHQAWFKAHGGTHERSLAPSHAEAARAIDSLGAPAFVSVDLDVLAAAHAPGVSALNPNGMTVREVARYVQAASAAKNVRCFDIMELNPLHDEQGRTARVAAHLFLTFAQSRWEHTTAQPSRS
ncbi:hypothetical protein BH11PLA1_BH11PLA1_08770 [soil metagenome]